MSVLKGRLQNSSLWMKLLLFLLLMILCGGLVMSVIILCPHINLKLLQFLQTLAVFCVPSVLAAYLFSPQPFEYLYLKSAPSGYIFLLVVFLMIAALPFVNLLGWVNQQLHLPAFLSSLEALMLQQEEAANALLASFLDVDNFLALIVNLIVMALVPAISEELCFRATLYNIFSDNRSKHAAIWVCAVIFSAVHLQFLGFVPRMLMGALFGYLLLYSNSLWLPIAAHLTNNFSVVALYYVFKSLGKDVDALDTLGTGDTLWLGILSAVLTIAMLYVVFRELKKNKR